MNSNVFTQRRGDLRDVLNKSIITLTAHTLMQRTNDAHYLFDQEANFWYLTGIDAPDWKLLMIGTDEWLVAPQIDDIHHVFDGSLSREDASITSGITHVIDIKQADKLLQNASRIYNTVCTIGVDPRTKSYNFHQNPSQAILRRDLKKLFRNVYDCRSDIARLRAIKRPEEITAIRKAIAITSDVFINVKKQLPTIQFEYEVEAEFTYRFRKSGARGHAYDPIVAGGKNACTLHYNSNQSKLPKNGLLLLDIGARVNGYAADITRTYAVGTPRQRECDVHAAVKRAHHAIINLLKPGLALSDYSAAVDRIMKHELTGLGLMNTDADHRKYFPHAISHGLGIDVHDSLGGPTHLKPGMVLTVEPGIYIPEEGIGVRIEDDILITDNGHENLSGSLATSL